MASDESKKADHGSSFAGMSIARFIPRFTKPRLLTSHIPNYRHSFSLPVEESKTSASEATSASSTTQEPEQQSTKSSSDQPNAPEKDETGASYVEWNKILPVPSNLLGSFHDLFSPRLGVDKAVTSEPPQDGQVNSASIAPTTSASPPPRLVFFGEQHHQPQVMRAQLQTLHALHQQCQLASDKADASSPIYRVHLVLEHFSVLDQEMLTSFSHGKLGPDELAESYQTKSEEAFHIGHYMPLLLLAKELKVPIWGGFPPRSWARQVFRDGVDGVKGDEQRRVESVKIKSTPEEKPAQIQQTTNRKATLQPPLFTAWSAVTKISAAHRSYLSGLMRPDLPPRFPQLPDAESDSTATDELRHLPIYPTWLLKPYNIETKGFGPAQALKDSYLAHVTAWILRGAQSDTSATSAEQEQSQTQAAEMARPVVNVALVVCGLGHCEYGFGAPERVVQLLSRQDASSDASSTLLPYIIASKPLDSGIWLGYEHSAERSDAGAISTAMPPQASIVTERKASPEAVKQWLDDSWGRKMADAVLLYDWIDDEPADDANANADGHQPATTSAPTSTPAPAPTTTTAPASTSD